MGRRVAKYCKELKKFGIRYAHKAQEGYPLAGVVRVADAGGKGYVRVKFSEALVTAVGKAMPFGVSMDTPCYLKAVQNRSNGSWRVYAFYFGKTKGAWLWQSPDRPEWLKHVRRV